MATNAITLKDVYERLERLQGIVERIADDLHEEGELSEEALEAIRDARATPEQQYVTLE